ncbi:hypothetical protein BGZ83_008165 [Gryganskiella cystojenkinii]|nr:hypothetical protein BGZ83_008165 [Gryganskiella cystojenkinii]
MATLSALLQTDWDYTWNNKYRAIDSPNYVHDPPKFPNLVDLEIVSHADTEADLLTFLKTRERFKKSSHDMIFERLSTLRYLETLDVSRPEKKPERHGQVHTVSNSSNDVDVGVDLNFRLSRGLGKLKTLRSLSYFSVLDCEDVKVQVKDVAWMIKHWPSLSQNREKEMLDEKLAALEDSSRRLTAVDFSAPRLYSALLLENQAVPVRSAKPFERNLFAANGSDTIRNIRTKEGADEFETAMELATTLNEICQNQESQARLENVSAAHEDVLSSISGLTAQLTEACEHQDPNRQEGDAILADITREEGEIFALEQLLNEKRAKLNEMEQALDELTDFPGAEPMDEDDPTSMNVDLELDAEAAASKVEIERLENTLQDQRHREAEQSARYEQLLRECEELEANQQTSDQNAVEESSPHFDEFLRLWEKVAEMEGDTEVEPVGAREAHKRLDPLLDSLERSQRHIVQLDVIHQTLIGSCADSQAPEFDPPQAHNAVLAARTLQTIYQAGGAVPLPELKDRIAKEALSLGESQSAGIQTVYSLIAAQLIQLDRTVNPNMASFK